MLRSLRLLGSLPNTTTGAAFQEFVDYDVLGEQISESQCVN